MSPAHKTYLEKMGVNKGSLYVICMFLSGGGYIEKNHSDATAAIQAQIAEMSTSIALAEQLSSQQEKKLDQIDHDLRQLTRSFDRNNLKPMVSLP